MWPWRLQPSGRRQARELGGGSGRYHPGVFRDRLALGVERRTLLLWLATRGLVAVLLVGVPGVSGAFGGSFDVAFYRAYATATLHGSLPYRDFQPEYPPGAFLFFLIPALLARSAQAYLGWFVIQNLLLDLAVVVLLSRADAREGGARAYHYTLALAPVLPVVLLRYDLGPGFLLLASVYLAALGRWQFSWALLGLAVAAKGYPLVVAPFLAREQARVRGRSEVVVGAVAAGSLAALFFVPFLLLAPGGVASSFGYQASRGIHTESIYATLGLLLGFLGVRWQVVYTHRAFDLAFPGARILGMLSWAVILLLLWLLWKASEGREGGRGEWDLLTLGSLATGAFFVGFKVFSPQFLADLYPVLFLSPLCGMPVIRGRSVGELGVAISLLSLLAYVSMFRVPTTITLLLFAARIWLLAATLAGVARLRAGQELLAPPRLA